MKSGNGLVWEQQGKRRKESKVDTFKVRLGEKSRSTAHHEVRYSQSQRRGYGQHNVPWLLSGPICITLSDVNGSLCGSMTIFGMEREHG
jgi:hypothetical protein